MRTDPHRFIVPGRKVTEYLLNPAHPQGGPKARFFIARGFSQAEPDRLAATLSDHAVAPSSRTTQSVDAFGTDRLVAVGPARMPDGTEPIIRSVWRETEPGIAHLVTAYPIRGRG